ncbi:uncharacterized protein LOC119114807 [Pollicipes pollicipes]|uniref:uncharacterized protein LOC119114807 n=1 Tax=Pollicipes pollicipes TaxID=41117 RepID=UPI0018856B59|nr:uncharacterized protein LOC119114807 [Pollicipes pollicipes]
MLPLRAAVCLLALAHAGSGAGDGARGAGPERSVLDVQPPSEELRTDGSNDLGFSADPRPAPATEGAGAGAAVSRLWGVADATARAGRLFLHTIDKHAFHGQVLRYEASGAGGPAVPLPRWLTFDRATATFAGVPARRERGPQLVTLRAVGADGSAARDRFMIDVLLDTESTHEHSPADPIDALSDDFDGCHDGSATTVGSVYFDFVFGSLSGAERIEVLQAVARELRVDAELIHVATHTGSLPLDDPATVEAGPGVKAARAQRLTRFSWKVGCGEQLDPARRWSLEAVRADSRLSQLSAAAGRPAVGWTLQTRHSSRHRRQADNSGDHYDEDYYYEDYDLFDGEGEDVRRGEVYDGRLDETYDDSFHEIYDASDPEERVVPTLASPAFQGPPASPVYPPPRISAPVLLSRMSTPIPVTVLPTVYSPDGLEPSRVVEEPPMSPYPGHAHS